MAAGCINSASSAARGAAGTAADMRLDRQASMQELHGWHPEILPGQQAAPVFSSSCQHSCLFSPAAVVGHSGRPVASTGPALTDHVPRADSGYCSRRPLLSAGHHPPEGDSLHSCHNLFVLSRVYPFAKVTHPGLVHRFPAWQQNKQKQQWVFSACGLHHTALFSSTAL